MAAVIHPTGTGKSMIAFKLVEQHLHNHFLWLSPSEYIYKTQLENIDTQFSNIEYMSYSRLMKHEDSIDTLHPDYIILDEFHRCGAAEWGKSVRKLLEAYPKAKRLGLSATNIRYLDNQRNMAEELFEGNIASEMTLGVRLTFDNNYFNALYQGIPVGGYTKMIANLLDGVEVRLNTDYLENKAELDALADKVVYTGPIDAYFDYKLGTLEYRSVRFETETLDKPNFQGNAAVNYTDRETPWTRIIEHKWFEFGKDENENDLPKTIISREYSSEWKPGDEPYYPVNDAKNSLLYSEYKKLADAEEKVIFGGRLGEYKYYDMDQVIAAVLDKCAKELGE